MLPMTKHKHRTWYFLPLLSLITIPPFQYSVLSADSSLIHSFSYKWLCRSRFYCSFISSVKWRTQVSSMVTNKYVIYAMSLRQYNRLNWYKYTYLNLIHTFLYNGRCWFSFDGSLGTPTIFHLWLQIDAKTKL